MLEIIDGKVKIPSASEVSTVKVVPGVGSNRPKRTFPYACGQFVEVQDGDKVQFLKDNLVKFTHDCKVIEPVISEPVVVEPTLELDEPDKSEVDFDAILAEESDDAETEGE